jgi:hypothetical protein
MTTGVVGLKILEFTRTPGPRKKNEGHGSGEEFLEAYLLPRFLEAQRSGSTLHVDLNGAAGFPTSFLEEAFGGLAREFGSNVVETVLTVTCEDEPYVEDEVRRYVQEAAKPR